MHMAEPDSSHRRNLLFIAALAVPVALLLVLSVFSHRLAATGKETQTKITKLETDFDTLHSLLLGLVDNETGQRGYVLTQKTEFLEPYEWSLKAIPDLARSLEGDLPNPQARADFEKVRAAMEARLQFARRSVDLQRQGKHDQSVTLITNGEGKKLMDEFRKSVALLESDLAADRQNEIQQSLQFLKQNESLSWFTVGIYLLFVLCLLYLVFNYRQNQQLLRFCVSSKTVYHQGQWLTFEEYLSKRFDIHVSRDIDPVVSARLFAQIKSIDLSKPDTTDLHLEERR